MSLAIRRPGWLTPMRLDVLIATLLLVELELESWLDTMISPSHRATASFLVVVWVLPLVFRSRRPGAALLACAALGGGMESPPAGNILYGMTGTIIPMIIMSFTVGERVPVRRGLLLTAGTISMLAGGAAWSVSGAPPAGRSLGSEVAFSILMPSVAWAMGWLWGERKRREHAFRDLLARVDSERELHEQASAMRERARIGHELQDVIAQNVSAIIIQAGGARAQIGGDPDRAASAILSVERAGREALADLRRTLGLLRSDEDPRRLAPQPGLEQLGSLMASSREGGRNCALQIEGTPERLEIGTDLVAYRTIEAALNARSAERLPVDVLVAHGAEHLDLEISGQGSAVGLADELSGITERVALYGGSLRVGATGTDGYAIHVRLPTRETAA